MGSDTTLPEAATRRFAEGAFSSGLSVPDFAACVQMGLQPVGLVQGFCAMKWSPYMASGFMQMGFNPYGTRNGYLETYQCPHGFISSEHRAWGQNYEQDWVESSWMEGFQSAYSRMVDEATTLGAHGIVGVVDVVAPISDTGIVEFHLTGTAVKTDGSAPSAPWSTYLAGQRLAKVFEAGLAPVAIVVAVSSIRVWAYCITQYLISGRSSMMMGTVEPTEITQISRARSAAREVVRTHARQQLEGDALHGVQLVEHEREVGEGDIEVQTILRGNRLRRFATVEKRPAPQAVVRLS